MPRTVALRVRALARLGETTAVRAWALGRMGDQRAHDLLEAGLRDGAPRVRANCAAALRRLSRWLHPGESSHYATTSSSSVTSMSRMR